MTKPKNIFTKMLSDNLLNVRLWCSLNFEYVLYNVPISCVQFNIKKK